MSKRSHIKVYALLGCVLHFALACQADLNGTAPVPPTAMAPSMTALPTSAAMPVAGASAVAAAPALPPSSSMATPMIPAMIPAAQPVATAPSGPVVMPGDSSGTMACKYIRKNAKKMTAQERDEFVKAVLMLKDVPSPYDPKIKYYDQFVKWHTELQLCVPNSDTPLLMGHAGPMLLPWHREHLLLFDEALRSVSDSKTITTPYWDWTDPDINSVFSDDFMGGTGDTRQNNAVTSGPFRRDSFTVRVDPVGLTGGGSMFLQRFLGSPGMLPKPSEVDAALAIPNYDTAPWDLTSDPNQSFRQRVEGNTGRGSFGGHNCPSSGVMPLPIGGVTMHNAIHAWVGGAMSTSASTNDPVFWLHHAQVDRIWDMWQQKHGVDTYVPLSGFPANNANDEMAPFSASGIHVTAAMVADNRKFGVCYE